jgi:hypothetical protein
MKRGKEEVVSSEEVSHFGGGDFSADPMTSASAATMTLLSAIYHATLSTKFTQLPGSNKAYSGSGSGSEPLPYLVPKQPTSPLQSSSSSPTTTAAQTAE